MMILVRLIASTSLWRPQRHNHGQDRADSDDADRDVPSAGRRVPIAVAEDDHGHKLRDRVYGTKCCRAHSTTTSNHGHHAPTVPICRNSGEATAHFSRGGLFGHV